MESGDDARPSGRAGLERFRNVVKWFAAGYGQPLWRRVGAGALAAIAGSLLRLVVNGLFENRLTYATFYPVIELASLVGGVVAGGSATLLSAVLAHGLFVPLARPADLLGLALFFATSFGLVGITEALHRFFIRATRAERRVEQEERLRVADERLRLAMSAGAIGAWDYDPAADLFTDASVDMRQMFGFAPDLRVDLAALLAVIAPDDRQAVRSALGSALDPHGAGQYRVDYRIRRPNDGAERWISARAQAFFENGRANRLVGICRDTTDEKSFERLLAEKARLAEQFARVAAAVPGVICSFRQTADGRRSFPYVSEKFPSLYGLSIEEARADARCVLERIHPDDLNHVQAGAAESARTLTLWRDEFRYRHPTRGMIWLEGQSSPVAEPNGDIVWHGYVKDVTERKRAEQDLRESEARSRALFDSGLIGVITWTTAGAVTSANDKFLEMLGYDRRDLEEGRIDWKEATPLEYRRLDEAGLEDLKRTGVNVRPFEKEFVRKDGTRAPVLVAGAMLDEARTQGVAFVLDITERKQAEAQTQRLYLDRMNLMESMAAGLAHEINQPLTATIAYLKTARRLLELPPEARPATVAETLDKAASQITRAGQIVIRLREFIAHGEPDKLSMKLHEMILDAYEASGIGSKTSGVIVTLRLEAENDKVLADRVQIEQVLVNLIRNAEEAMSASKRRELTIETVSNGAEIRVAISDTGVGLSGKVKLFQPFSTTKPSGMGVGLSISRAIIEAHHGKIWAEANSEGGAVFKFTLPLADNSVLD